MTFGHGVVDRGPVLRAVRRHRLNLGLDLIQQLRDCGDVADIVRGQLRGDDLMCVGVDAEVQKLWGERRGRHTRRGGRPKERFHA